jgi:hypothetical protein
VKRTGRSSLELLDVRGTVVVGGRAALEEGRAVLQLLDTEQEWTVSKRREDEVESM